MQIYNVMQKYTAALEFDNSVRYINFCLKEKILVEYT